MRKTIASISVFILVVSLLLTSCGKKRTFEPSGVTGERQRPPSLKEAKSSLSPINSPFTAYRWE